MVSIIEDRPNAHNFSYATVLHEWTKATDIQLRFLRTKTLKANLMDVARQDPTTFRRVSSILTKFEVLKERERAFQDRRAECVNSKECKKRICMVMT